MTSTRKNRVLTVDDDPDLAALVTSHLRRWKYRADSVASAAEMWRYLEHTTPDVLLLDLMLEDADGSELLRKLRERLSDLPMIMITRSDSVEAAVRCMRRGAEHYIKKPLDFERLRQVIINAELRRSRDETAEIGDIVGRSPAMRRVSTG